MKGLMLLSILQVSDKWHIYLLKSEEFNNERLDAPIHTPSERQTAHLLT